MQERGRFHAEEALASTGDGVDTIGVSAEVTRSCFLSALRSHIEARRR